MKNALTSLSDVQLSDVARPSPSSAKRDRREDTPGAAGLHTRSSSGDALAAGDGLAWRRGSLRIASAVGGLIKHMRVPRFVRSAPYLVGLHSVLMLAILFPGFVSDTYRNLGPTPFLTERYKGAVGVHSMRDRAVAPGGILMFGDSILCGVDLKRIGPSAENFSIPGDTTEGLLWRIPQYRSVRNASTVVIAIGVNDLSRYDPPHSAENLRRILSNIPVGTRVIVMAVLPVDERRLRQTVRQRLLGWRTDNTRVRELNDALKLVCADRANCCFVNPNANDAFVDCEGNLRDELHSGDGLHLGPVGLNTLEDRLTQALSESSGFQHADRTALVPWRD